MGAIVAWLLANVVPEALKALFGMAGDKRQADQAKADAVELGQGRQARVDQDQALAAEQRMDAAGAKPRDAATTSGSLHDGTF